MPNLVRRSRIRYGASGLSFDSVSLDDNGGTDGGLCRDHNGGLCGRRRASIAYVAYRREGLSLRHVRGGCLRRGYAHDRLSTPSLRCATVARRRRLLCRVFRNFDRVAGLVSLSGLSVSGEDFLVTSLVGSHVSSRDV